MANRYEDKTQRLVSHNWSEEYKENHERIFGKKETWLERREREEKECVHKNKVCTYESDDGEFERWECKDCGKRFSIEIPQ